MYHYILILSCAFLTVHGATFSPKCKPDRACVTRHTEEIYKSFFENENNQLDPMYHKVIEEDFGVIKYTLTNTTVKGFKKCSVKSANLDLKKLQLDVDLYCPELHLIGTYDIKGVLISMPVEGNGAYTVDSKSYDLKIRMGVSLIPEGDKHHLHTNNFSVDSFPLEEVDFNLENLFNGQKELAENTLKFLHDNWKVAVNLLQEPIFRANFKKIIKETNKFFKEQEIENFIEL